MRQLIVILASAGLLLGACSDDSSETKPDMAVKKDGPAVQKDTGGAKKDTGNNTKDHGLTTDGPVTKPDKGKPKPDGPVTKPDKGILKPDQKLPKPDSGGKAPCKAWDAKGVGMCSMFLGYVWDGSKCKGISGCSCGGVDCKYIYSSPTKCSAGQAHCGATPSCKPMDAKGVGNCKMLLGWYYNGKTCSSLSGCSCAGTDCSKLYKSSGACNTAYAACP